MASVKNSDIPTPTRGYGQGSFYRLWHYLKPYDGGLSGTAQLNDKWFVVYFTVVAWAVVAGVGLGSEVTLGHTLMIWITSHEAGIVIWHLAQMAFSLMLSVAFSADGGYGMPFLAIGLWKFGFPETVNCLVLFLNKKNKWSLGAIASLIDGYGTLLHHLSTSFTLVALMMHMFPRDRALTAGCIVPIMQHMFILVKYHAHTTYIILELALEFWFQWEVIWNIPAFETHLGLEITRIGRGMAMTMLLAHWLYFAGSCLHMLDDMTKPKVPTLGSKDSLTRGDTMSQMLATSVQQGQDPKKTLRQRIMQKAESVTQAVESKVKEVEDSVNHAVGSAMHEVEASVKNAVGSAMHEVEAAVLEGEAQAGKFTRVVEASAIHAGHQISRGLSATCLHTNVRDVDVKSSTE